MKVLIASNNQNKIREMKEILEPCGMELISLSEAGIASDPEETAQTFEGNALIKALAAHVASGGMAAMADDSGLEVDALGGEPGVYSARYAGADCDDQKNNDLLLKKLELVDADDRTARFVCTLALVYPDGSHVTTRGEVQGKIGFTVRGENGFGYDPLFLPDAYDGELTFAEVSAEEKNRISHRANALREMSRVFDASHNNLC